VERLRNSVCVIGELERLQKFWLAGTCKKTKESDHKSNPLGILNFTSAFILLAGGMVLGAVLLAWEHGFFLFLRRRLRQCDSCQCCGLVSIVR
jgi:ionotropic glutamate receptor NMDA 2B